jgi:hypothetical protein
LSHLKPAERAKLLEHRLSVSRLRLESIEFDGIPRLDPYASAAWDRCLDVLRSEIEWLSEELAKEQQKLYESQYGEERQAISLKNKKVKGNC